MQSCFQANNSVFEKIREERRVVAVFLSEDTWGEDFAKADEKVRTVGEPQPPKRAKKVPAPKALKKKGGMGSAVFLAT